MIAYDFRVFYQLLKPVPGNLRHITAGFDGLFHIDYNPCPERSQRGRLIAFEGRRFGAVLPPGRHERAFLAEVRSTAYGDLGTKALLSSLVAVSS